MEKQINLTTRFQKGWNARIAVVGGIDELEAGEGISINGNTISLLPIPDVAGSYTNPTVTVDETGRVVGIENGTLPSALNAEVVDTTADVDAYSGDASALVVRDAGEGRSALYIRDEANVFQGPAYLTGSRGAPGENGRDGKDGADGATGAKGDTGERGPEGPQGQRGPQGEAGPAGSNGMNGAEGPQGPQGPMGPTGSALVPNGYGTLDEDRVTAMRALQGPYFYLVNDMGDIRADNRIPTGISGDMSRHVIGWNGTFFTDYGPLTGAQGVQGIQGPQGPQGERGPQGLTGATGLQGIAGPKGDRGIAGQNGEQGIQGPQGPKGDKGDKGDSGSVGQTAYTWTSAVRSVTADDNGSLFRLNGVPSVNVIGNLPDDGFIDFANVGSSVCFVNYGSGSSVKLYPGDLWRLSNGYSMFIGRRAKVLLSSVTAASPAQNTLQLDIPIGAVNDFDRIQIEVEGIAPVSGSTLHLNTVDTVADNAWGTAHPVAQNQNLSPAHIVITVRAGRQPITAVGTLEATTYHFSTTIHKGAARNPNRFRFIYGSSPGVNIAANGGRIQAFGMDRVV